MLQRYWTFSLRYVDLARRATGTACADNEAYWVRKATVLCRLRNCRKPLVSSLLQKNPIAIGESRNLGIKPRAQQRNADGQTSSSEDATSMSMPKSYDQFDSCAAIKPFDMCKALQRALGYPLPHPVKPRPKGRSDPKAADRSWSPRNVCICHIATLPDRECTAEKWRASSCCRVGTYQSASGKANDLFDQASICRISPAPHTLCRASSCRAFLV